MLQQTKVSIFPSALFYCSFLLYFNEMCFVLQYCDKIIETYFEKCSKVSPLSREYKNVCADEYCRKGGGKQTTCDTYSELARLCAYDGPGDYEHWRDDSAVVCGRCFSS